MRNLLTIFKNRTLKAAGLPMGSQENALYFGAASSSVYTRFLGSNLGLPAGDWSLGLFVSIPRETNTGVQVLLNASEATTNAYSTANSFSIQYRSSDGRIAVHGADASNNTLGQRSPPLPNGNVNANALISNIPVFPGQSFLLVVVKTGNLAQLFMKFDGHTAIKVDESYTSAGAINPAQHTLGIGRNSTNWCRLKMRNLFKLSFALTPAQIDQIGNGANPETFGAPAVNDFRYPLNVNAATINDAINRIALTRTFDNASVVTGVGYAPQAEAVFLRPTGPDGHVFQHNGGAAIVNLSGTYQGADGADIQIQLLDEKGRVFKGWTKIASSIQGGTWSGSLMIPKGKRWIRAQLRKFYGTPPTGLSGPSGDVMTTTLRFGVGEVVFLSGQSLMEHMGSTLAAYAENVATPNGYVSQQDVIPSQITLSGALHFAVTGVANNGSGGVRISASGRHGLFTGQKVYVLGVGGTVEANGKWTVNVVDRTNFDLVGSTFSNAYTSGGYVYYYNSTVRIMDNALQQYPDGHAIIGNAISNATNAVVCISNRAFGGQAIGQFNSLSVSNGINNFSATAFLAAESFNRVVFYLWLHGHQNIGQTSYFSDAGSVGAWTGYGELGKLYDLVTANMPNADLKFGLAAFSSIGGTTGSSATNTHNYRLGMRDWVRRKKEAGNNNVFFTGFYHDLQPQWENGVTQNAHLPPPYYRIQAARLGHSVAQWNGCTAEGPEIIAAARSGACIDLQVRHNGGTSLKVLAQNAVPSGFEVATDAAFSNKLSISNVEITGPASLRLSLAADPNATCYVRYQFGQVGPHAVSTYFTPRVTGVADNGSGVIRVTCAAAPVTPTGSQRAGGHGLVTGQWVNIIGVAGATQANGIWQVAVIDAENIDLVGSSAAGLGSFVAGSNLWQANATGVIATDIGVPIYDDRLIGGYDPNGAPLQPTKTYLVAA